MGQKRTIANGCSGGPNCHYAVTIFFLTLPLFRVIAIYGSSATLSQSFTPSTPKASKVAHEGPHARNRNGQCSESQKIDKT